MNLKTSFLSFASLASVAKVTVASLALALAGCVTDDGGSDETQDGGNVVFAQEGKSMALLLDGSSGAAKSAATLSDTAIDPVTLEKIIVPLHYDADCNCHIRFTQFTNTKKGFGRSRTDSIWLYDDGVALFDSFRPGNADSIVHVRHVKRIDGQSSKDVDITARTTLVRIPTDSGTVYAWTGTISGNFKGREIAGSTFNMTRHFNLGNGFGVPMGRMSVKRGPHFLALVYNADGTITVTVTRNGKFVRTTRIDENDHEE